MPEFFLKRSIFFGFVIGLLKFFKRRDKCFRCKPATIRSKVSPFVRQILNFISPVLFIDRIMESLRNQLLYHMDCALCACRTWEGSFSAKINYFGAKINN